MIFECMILVMIIYLLFFMLFYKLLLQEIELMSPYECGFDPSSGTRTSFSYRFFLISILFLIFDVEITLILPFPFLLENMMGVWLFIMFIFILLLGLLYEYNQGSLNWLSNFVSKA